MSSSDILAVIGDTVAILGPVASAAVVGLVGFMVALAVKRIILF